MLMAKMGWKRGEGLGSESQGMSEWRTMAPDTRQPRDTLGLGAPPAVNSPQKGKRTKKVTPLPHPLPVVLSRSFATAFPVT